MSARWVLPIALLAAGCAWLESDPEAGPASETPPEPPPPIASRVGIADFRLTVPPERPGPAVPAHEPAAVREEEAVRPLPPPHQGVAPVDTGSLVESDDDVEPAPAIDAAEDATPPEVSSNDEPRLDVLGGPEPTPQNQTASVAEPEEGDLLERLEKGPDASEALRRLLDLYLWKGQLIRAHELVATHRRHVDENDFETLLLLARLYDRLGETERSHDYLDRAQKKQGPVKGLQIVGTSLLAREGTRDRYTYRPTRQTVYYRNDHIHVRVDLADWGIEEAGGRYRVRQAIDCRLVDSRGRDYELPPKCRHFDVQKAFPDRPAELVHTIRDLRLPYDLRPGRYALVIEIVDQLKSGAGSKAETRVEIEVQ